MMLKCLTDTAWLHAVTSAVKVFLIFMLFLLCQVVNDQIYSLMVGRAIDCSVWNA